MAAEDGEQTHDGDIPKEGDILAGKYRIERVLGQGGMGVVVAAHHTTLRQKVAVKFLLPDGRASAATRRERFLREARAGGRHPERARGPGDRRGHARHRRALHGDGVPHRRRPRRSVLEQRGALPVAEAVDYVLQACEAIAEAHALGIIHRDLKPANLFLTHARRRLAAGEGARLRPLQGHQARTRWTPA